MDLDKDYYAILGIAPNADVDALKTAFRLLVKQYHPDVMPEWLPGAEERFRQVNEAYRVLSDPQSRRAYDTRRFGPVAERRTEELDLDSKTATSSFTDIEANALADAAADDHPD
jgi:DnaJ-class molecular chaperone